MKILLNIMALLFIIGCTPNPSHHSDEAKEDALNQLEAVDVDFYSFLNYFNSDTDFQKSRVLFPLKLEYLGENMEEIVQERIGADEYQIIDLSYSEDIMNREQDAYEQIVNKISDNMMSIELRGVENGINVQYRFQKILDRWYLEFIGDYST